MYFLVLLSIISIALSLYLRMDFIGIRVMYKSLINNVLSCSNNSPSEYMVIEGGSYYFIFFKQCVLTVSNAVCSIFYAQPNNFTWNIFMIIYFFSHSFKFLWSMWFFIRLKYVEKIEKSIFSINKDTDLYHVSLSQYLRR